jgi:ABC-type polysaccharide/polyol phosphate export permease
MNLFFYATPIIYPLSLIPKESGGLPAREIISLNPLAKFVQASRDIFYGIRLPSFGTMAYLFIWSIAVLVAGWTIFHKWARDVSEEL